ncbi:hypothetical protein J8J27_25040, partial [Mycobacterium tuberculosis]|nr:hypothetical protein [Mycobacterium tuberculosis]
MSTSAARSTIAFPMPAAPAGTAHVPPIAPLPSERRLWQLDGFGLNRLRLVAAPLPVPGAGEVLVRVGAVSLNYKDLLLADGKLLPQLTFP